MSLKLDNYGVVSAALSYQKIFIHAHLHWGTSPSPLNWTPKLPNNPLLMFYGSVPMCVSCPADLPC